MIDSSKVGKWDGKAALDNITKLELGRLDSSLVFFVIVGSCNFVDLRFDAAIKLNH